MRLELRLPQLGLRQAEVAALAGMALVIALGAGSIIVGVAALHDAQAQLRDREETLARLIEAARRRTAAGANGAGLRSAPPAAFIQAPTAGQASAQLQAYLASLAAARHVSVTSSGAAPAGRDDADSVRLQATFDLAAPTLQSLLYALETGTPYVFVDALSAQAPSGATRNADPTLRVTTTLRALWRRSDI